MISLVDSQTAQTELLTDRAKLSQQVDLAVNQIPAVDIHTHELRTPLTELRALAEVNLTTPGNATESEQSW